MKNNNNEIYKHLYIEEPPEELIKEYEERQKNKPNWRDQDKPERGVHIEELFKI